MKYTSRETPPENRDDYIKVPSNEIKAEFVKSLVNLLREKTPFIYTEAVSVDFLEAAIEESKVSHYRVSMMPVEVNDSQHGIAHGVFFFEFQGQNRSKL